MKAKDFYNLSNDEFTAICEEKLKQYPKVLAMVMQKFFYENYFIESLRLFKIDIANSSYREIEIIRRFFWGQEAQDIWKETLNHVSFIKDIDEFSSILDDHNDENKLKNIKFSEPPNLYLNNEYLLCFLESWGEFVSDSIIVALEGKSEKEKMRRILSLVTKIKNLQISDEINDTVLLNKMLKGYIGPNLEVFLNQYKPYTGKFGDRGNVKKSAADGYDGIWDMIDDYDFVTTLIEALKHGQFIKPLPEKKERYLWQKKSRHFKALIYWLIKNYKMDEGLYHENGKAIKNAIEQVLRKTIEFTGTIKLSGEPEEKLIKEIQKSYDAEIERKKMK